MSNKRKYRFFASISSLTKDQFPFLFPFFAELKLRNNTNNNRRKRHTQKKRRRQMESGEEEEGFVVHRRRKSRREHPALLLSLFSLPPSVSFCGKN